MLWYTTSGAGPPLVLCHGGPGMWDYLGPLAQLVDDRATVVRYDQRGCGRSPGDGPFSIAQSVADLDELRNDLGYDVVDRRRTLVGRDARTAVRARASRTHDAPRLRLGRRDRHGVERGLPRRGRPQAFAEQNARLAALDAITEPFAAEEREFRVLSWLPDNATELADAPLRDQRRGQPRDQSSEMKRGTKTSVGGACRTRRAGAHRARRLDDPRPHWAIDSLAAALPDATVVKLPTPDTSRGSTADATAPRSACSMTRAAVPSSAPDAAASRSRTGRRARARRACRGTGGRRPRGPR